MGLFDYVTDIGKKLFGSTTDADAAVKVQEHILADNPGVQDLTVRVEGDTVFLAGMAMDQAAYEKTVLLAGNVKGIANVNGDEMTVKEGSDVQVMFYEIKSGDTLWKIADTFLGDGNQYPKIFEANKEVIKDADLIYPGQKIRIPGVVQNAIG